MASLNLDAQEMAKFEKMAAEWWDPYGPCKPLHELNPIRLEFIGEQAPLKNKKVLDVGCGGGILSESMARLGADVTGIDVSPTLIQTAQQHATKQGLTINYSVTTVESLAETHADQFDIITCMELLEHVPDPTSVVRACNQLAKKGGNAFFSTINRTPKAYLFAIIGAEYLLKLLPKGTHDYATFIRPSELAGTARMNGLLVQKFKGISYNILTQEYKLSDDISVNYMAHCQKL